MDDMTTAKFLGRRKSENGSGISKQKKNGEKNIFFFLKIKEKEKKISINMILIEHVKYADWLKANTESLFFSTLPSR